MSVNPEGPYFLEILPANTDGVITGGAERPISPSLPVFCPERTERRTLANPEGETDREHLC